MKRPTLIKQLMGYIIQVTEYKYSVPILRNDMLSDRVQFVLTCPVFTGPDTYCIITQSSIQQEIMMKFSALPL